MNTYNKNTAENNIVFTKNNYNKIHLREIRNDDSLHEVQNREQKKLLEKTLKLAYSDEPDNDDSNERPKSSFDVNAFLKRREYKNKVFFILVGHDKIAMDSKSTPFGMCSVKVDKKTTSNSKLLIMDMFKTIEGMEDEIFVRILLRKLIEHFETNFFVHTVNNKQYLIHELVLYINPQKKSSSLQDALKSAKFETIGNMVQLDKRSDVLHEEFVLTLAVDDMLSNLQPSEEEESKKEDAPNNEETKQAETLKTTDTPNSNERMLISEESGEPMSVSKESGNGSNSKENETNKMRESTPTVMSGITSVFTNMFSSPKKEEKKKSISSNTNTSMNTDERNHENNSINKNADAPPTTENLMSVTEEIKSHERNTTAASLPETKNNGNSTSTLATTINTVQEVGKQVSSLFGTKKDTSTMETNTPQNSPSTNVNPSNEAQMKVNTKPDDINGGGKRNTRHHKKRLNKTKVSKKSTRKMKNGNRHRGIFASLTPIKHK